MTIKPTIEPEQVGFDPTRLARIDRHFARYVDDGRLAGWQIVVTRRGEVAHAATYGHRDREAGRPVEPDTLWRVYSMTKPLTSVAVMMLWEQGHFQLTDELSRWLPAFAGVRVLAGGTALQPVTVPAVEPIRIWHLLTHTAGLTYGFQHSTAVDELYRSVGFDLYPPDGVDLARACDTLARLPLLFQPGTAFGYSVATDVLGRLVEVISGQRLDEFLAEHVIGPLAMTDTRWHVETVDADRLAALYAVDPATGLAVRYDELGRRALAPPSLLSGGAGLISTAADYHRFTQLMLRGGELDGVRLLGNRTVRMMTRNHLPAGADLATFTTGGFAETTLGGIGFGLGVAVVEDPVPSRLPSSVGEYYWGGAAGTAFWVDPVEQITALLLIQLMPSNVHPLRANLRQLVYSALID